MKMKLLLVIPLIASLAACGGSGDGTTSSNGSSTGTVSVIITDNLTLTYSEVWVSLQAITATDANGQVVDLYRNTAGQTHNLSQLVNIGALVDAQTIAAGTYTTFEILMDNQIQLVDPTGVTTNATFDQTGNPSFTLSVAGQLVVDENQMSSLLLDFDLQQFTYDMATNTVNPVVIQQDPATLNQTVATVNGQVQAVNSSTQFVVTPATGGANITVDLHATATVTDTASATVAADTTLLAAGMQVTVDGIYDPANLSITASAVGIVTGASVTINSEVEGIVTAFDGSTLTIDVKEASFLPGSNTLTIANSSNALFSHGSLALLTIGQEVEIKGNWDNTTFTAATIEIEGAPSNATDSNYLDDYVEFEGTISAIDGDLLTLTVQEFEHVSGITIGDSVMIDRTNSWYKDGDASCLSNGAVIEAKGSMSDATTMIAMVIDLEDSCNGSNDDDDDDSDDDD
ncbi:MAG: DUF4382 domain-containing protein [Gammaproteobacteria bacterium]|nr:DUF4382 domain-containing protein [Gammaproteobacteria bacterium]